MKVYISRWRSPWHAVHPLYPELPLRGPAEILDNGTYGQLISPGDRDGMVNAIIAAIDHPESLPSKEKLMERAKRFSAEKIFLNIRNCF
jgi:glycosyltransferase involved in cell wall biosynthesis